MTMRILNSAIVETDSAAYEHNSKSSEPILAIVLTFLATIPIPFAARLTLYSTET